MIAEMPTLRDFVALGTIPSENGVKPLNGIGIGGKKMQKRAAFFKTACLVYIGSKLPVLHESFGMSLGFLLSRKSIESNCSNGSLMRF